MNHKSCILLFIDVVVVIFEIHEVQVCIKCIIINTSTITAGITVGKCFSCSSMGRKVCWQWLGGTWGGVRFRWWGEGVSDVKNRPWFFNSDSQSGRIFLETIGRIKLRTPGFQNFSPPNRGSGGGSSTLRFFFSLLVDGCCFGAPLVFGGRDFFFLSFSSLVSVKQEKVLEMTLLMRGQRED